MKSHKMVKTKEVPVNTLLHVIATMYVRSTVEYYYNITTVVCKAVVLIMNLLYLQDTQIL